MKDKIITIIVPTYNMERYLDACLSSLLIQKNFDRLEVLVVNDGSTDSSSAIAHEYEKTYPGTFKVIDKKNGNYGSCVNVGLAAATGVYVKILDADDSVETAHFERFVAYLMQIDSDLILSDYVVVDEAGRIQETILYRLRDGDNTHYHNMDEVCCTEIFRHMQMHAVTYRRENLLQLGYLQTEGISYTDQQWIFLPMTMVKTVVCFGEYVYKYLTGRAGQTMDPTVKRKSLAHIIRCVLDMVVGYEYHKIQITRKPIRDYLYARLIPLTKEIYVCLLTHYGKDTKQQLIDFDNRLRELSEEIYDLIGSREVSSFMNFEYINFWRQNKDLSPLAVRSFSKIYLLLIKLKQLASKFSNVSILL